MKKLVFSLVVLAAAAVRAEDRPLTVEERLDALERRNAVLERRLESGWVTTAGKDGFSIRSVDGATRVRITGVIQTDYRDYLGDENLTDQFLMRRVRPSVEASIGGQIDLKIIPEFAGSVSLLDAYVDLKAHPLARFRAGKFKGPYGLERLQASAHNSFAELALPSNLTPNYETGAQVFGETPKGVLAYQLAVTNGVADGASGETDSNDGKDYLLRVFAHPFRKSECAWLSGIGLGVASSIGDQAGSAATSGLPSYRTNGQQTFFAYTAGSFADGRRTRLSPQAYWYAGRLGLLGEYVATNQDVTRVNVTTATATINNRAWQVALTCVLTGERASYKGVSPERPFEPGGGRGAFELAARYSELTVDREAFPVFAATAASARKARAWSGGLNWYLTSNAKIVSDFEYTTFFGGSSSGNRPHERAILTRLQVTY